MSVTAGVSDAIIAIREKLRGKIGQTKVKRYWPGRAPEWADEVDEDSTDLQTSRQRALDHAFPPSEDSTVIAADDPRLRRLAEIRSAGDRDEVRADHRRIRQAEIISTAEEEEAAAAEEDKEEDEDAVEERRRRIRERLLLKRQEEEEEVAPLEDEDEVEDEQSEEESEYETDSDEDEFGARALAKPVFVPKQERETIAERERIEAEEVALEVAVKRRMEERKAETKQIVVEKIREDEVIQKNLEASEANIADIDTDDELNEADEYESWKVREISRIKRDRDAREAMVKEKEEIDRVRNMTEDERREWERKNPKPSSQPKQKWRFMQKYYHKGAFFQEDADDMSGTAGSADIYHRDFSSPTGEDKMDKTILPKVMQVKHFGRSGRTKWTHLVNEDTTDWNNPWTYNDPLRAKYNAKMAGMRPIAKPKGSRKLKDWEQP